MPVLRDAVGPAQPNRSSDVSTVQVLLNRNLAFIVPIAPLSIDGRFGPSTRAAIEAYQQRVLRMSPPDGIIRPGGPTLQRLIAHVGPVALGDAAVVAPVRTLRDAEYVEAARLLDCEVAIIQAIAQTETKRGAFDASGRPTILFERHVFSRETGGKHDAKHPDISNPIAGGYGRYADQYGRLERAAALDHAAAHRSCSWGMFQIMGFNHARCGHGSLDAFVAAMRASVSAHLAAFTRFIASDAALLRAVRSKDWARIARAYNGEDYARNRYDVKLREHYDAIVGRMESP
jgi:peptidoglycan hydrolase-like protein with peptidoglycan-binding domain